MADLPLQMPSVPEGFCNSLNGANWVQTLINLIAQGVAVMDGSGFSVVLNQSTAPGPTDRDKLWRDTDTGRIYQWSGGAWVTPHPYEPSGIAGLWVEATPAEIWAFDGGDGQDPSVTAPATNVGAMWVIDPNYAGRSPMGVGAIPTANPAKNLAVGENYGEGAHTQGTQEVGPHTHALTIPNLSQSPGAGAQAGLLYQQTGTGSGNVAVPPTIQAENNTYTTVQQAMPVIHPVRGQYYIVRSARVNYVGS